ncbi:hypothetical protein Hdeb2414_s0002g00068801 [Helianthus debilis subsp. tardiflorus]
MGTELVPYRVYSVLVPVPIFPFFSTATGMALVFWSITGKYWSRTRTRIGTRIGTRFLHFLYRY